MDLLEHQAHQYMRGHVAALLVQFARHRHWGNLRRVAIDLPRYYSRRLLHHAFGRADARRPLFWPEVRGCASGIAYFLSRVRASQP
jgi:hypothetical protein